MARCTFADIPFIMVCLEEFHKEHPLHVEPDPEHVRHTIIQIIGGSGVALRTPNGILLAIETPSIWNPEQMELQELAFWVHPAHRGGTQGGRLLKEYSKLAESGRWAGVAIAQTPKTNMDFSKWGFIPSFSVAIKKGNQMKNINKENK